MSEMRGDDKEEERRRNIRLDQLFYSKGSRLDVQQSNIQTADWIRKRVDGLRHRDLDRVIRIDP